MNVVAQLQFHANKARRSERALVLVVALVLAGLVGRGGLALLRRGLTGRSAGDDLVIGAGLIVVSVGIAGLALYVLLAARRVREFRVEPVRSAVRLGEEVEVAIHLVPAQAMYLERLVARLVGHEVAVFPGADHDRSYDQDHVLAEQVVQQEQPLAAGIPRKFSAQLRVPTTAMHTFDELNCIYSWRVQVRLASRSWPEVLQEAPVTVVPEQVEAGHG